MERTSGITSSSPNPAEPEMPQPTMSMSRRSADSIGDSLSSLSSHASQHAGADLEKAETARDTAYLPIQPSPSDARPGLRSLAKTRSSVTDGFASYALGDDEDDDEGGDTLAPRRTPTNAYEVVWEGRDDPMSPRNMSLARKWLIVAIVSSCSFLV